MNKTGANKDAIVVVAIIFLILLAVMVGGFFWLNNQASPLPSGTGNSSKATEDERQVEDVDKSTLTKDKSLPPENEEEIPPHKRRLE